MAYIAAVVIISLIIIIHEAGHLAAARAVGVKIKIFSIGFGPALFAFKTGCTEYRFSLIPLGGYVLPDVADEQEFFALSPVKRFVFSLGGPAGNIIAALVALAAINIFTHGPSLHSLLLAPLATAASFTGHFFAAVPALFSRPEELSGIVGIVSQGGASIGADSFRALGFAALMNLNLALFNLLPLPVLDGGKIALYVMETVHPRMVRLHIPLSIASWVMILALTLYVTVMDIIKLA
jgi:regulator of sigma E protease